jgi:large subunit ribosomal protein L24
MNRKKASLKSLKTNFRKGDTIKIISGNYKGKIGKINAFEKNYNYVIIDSINRTKKTFNKDTKQFNDSTLKTLIHISNIVGIDLKTNILSSIRKKRTENKLIRYFKKSKTIIENIFNT